MVQPYPLPRELRQTSVLQGDGRDPATYGPFLFKIFDPVDVSASVRIAGGEWADAAVTVTRTTADALSFFTVTFPQVLTPADSFVVAGGRLHERSTDLTRGGALQTLEMEKEFSKIGVVLQEARRDIGRALKPPFGVSIGEGHVPIIDAAGNAIEGPSADDIADAQGHAEDAIGAQAAAEAARDIAIAAASAAAPKVIPSVTNGEEQPFPAVTQEIQTLFHRPIAPSPKTYAGGGRYRRVGLADIVGLGLSPRAYWRSLDRFMPDGSTDNTNGGYWALWEDVPSLEQLGGVGDATFDGNGDYVSGTDNADAWDALVQYMAARGLGGRIGAGQFYFSRELPHTATGVIRGAGKEQTRLHIRIAANEVGIRGRVTGCGLTHAEVRVQPYQAKGPLGGQLHACILVGLGFFESVDHPEIKDFTFTDLRLTRSGMSNGFGIYLMGNVTGGLVDRIDDIGNPKRSSGLFIVHWAARGVEGSSIVTSWHVRNVKVDNLHMENGSALISLSSCHGLKIGKAFARGASRLLVYLAGDETNAFAENAFKKKINRANRIDEIVFEDLLDTGSDIIEVTSKGTSRFRFYPAPDNAIVLEEQTYCELSIGKVTGANETPVTGTLLRSVFWYGNLHIGEIDVGDSMTGMLADISRSSGVRIDKIVGTGDFTGSGAVLISRSARILIPDLAVHHTNVATNGRRCFYAVGGRYDTTLAADAAQGATTIVIAALAQDIVRDALLLVNGNAVRSAGFFEAGCTSITVSPLPAAATTGQTVRLDDYLEAVDVGVNTLGGHTAIFVDGGQVTLRGKGPEGSGMYAYNFGAAATVDIIAPTPKRNGLQRISNGSAATREIVVSPGASIRVHGGVLGTDSQSTIDYNVGVPTSDGSADNRIILLGTRMMGSISGTVVAGSQTDYKFYNCLGPTGTALSAAGA